jgi:hypothetical protein
MESLPPYIGVVFALTTILAVWIFYEATGRSALSVVGLSFWLIVQGVVAHSGFYTHIDRTPSRFILLVLPPLVLIVILFLSPGGRRYIDRLNPATLTLLHMIRIPVELVLVLLFINGTVPQLMTLEGRNFDIFSGLTAPFIFYFGFVKRKIRKKWILGWNFICLGLLLNIVVNAVLSAPLPFQRFAFSQPNIAILYFPFVWLPCCIVPLVLFAHLATIRQIRRSPL